MTTVFIQKTENGTYRGFTCLGHSGFAHSGEDIVCAAISVLIINTINSMEELSGEELRITTKEEEGLIDCRFQREPSEKGNLLMDSMLLGLTGIVKQYGSEYLTLKFEEV